MRFLLEGVQYNDEQLQDSCIALFARSESPCYKYQALAYIARSVANLVQWFLLAICLMSTVLACRFSYFAHSDS